LHWIEIGFLVLGLMLVALSIALRIVKAGQRNEAQEREFLRQLRIGKRHPPLMAEVGGAKQYRKNVKGESCSDQVDARRIGPEDGQHEAHEREHKQN
jgi:hypothetical protein